MSSTQKSTELVLKITIAAGLCDIWYLSVEDPWLNPLMIGFFTLLILSLAMSKGIATQVLGSKALVYAGEASFSLYMTHGILQKIFKIALPTAPFAHSSGITRLGVLLVYACSLAITSVLTYQFIERPARQKLRMALAWRGADRHPAEVVAREVVAAK